MLILTRRANQSIDIGPDITVTILRVSNGNVRIGIDAPGEVIILRSELPPAPCSGEEPRGTSPQPGGA